MGRKPARAGPRRRSAPRRRARAAAACPTARRLARRHPQLHLDEVGAVDHLGDRVLHLQPGVHLHEEELVGVVAVHDELDRARAGVADRARRLDRRGPHRLPLLVGEQRRRRLLDDLLVPALQRALALAEVDHVAVGVGQDLDLDVPRVPDQALDEQGVVAEAAAGLAAGATRSRRRRSRTPVHLAHALAAAARARLEQHRVADLLDGQRERGVVEARPVRAGHHGHARLRHRLLGADLVAHRLDRRRRRPDEHDPRLLARGGERGVLGEEAVAGVHGLRAGGPGRVDHGRDREVALDAGRRRRPRRTCGASASASE